jgi:DNA-binding NarL/FixJ family response regulator
MTDEPESPAEPPARILIVDDEPLNVDYLEQELESLGFVTESAADGVEALERVATAPPDLVLLDVMMPGMDGISTLRILKDDPETRLMPVVLMTALNAVEDRVRGIEAGADDFLSKPVDDRELVARIRTALRAKRVVDETVGELRSTSDHLERYGSQKRDVAVLAIAWRLRDRTVPGGAVGFLGRRRRIAAEERLHALGGLPTEQPRDVLVAVFDGPDRRSRTIAALEAALAVLDDGRRNAAAGVAGDVTVKAAVAEGPARVGSSRVEDATGPRWVFGAEGTPVERARVLARSGTTAAVLVADDAAALVSHRFGLESVGDGAYRVLAPDAGEGDLDLARPSTSRLIKTILITDIVDSTRLLERIGDRAWVELLGEHDRLTREELVLFGGEEADTTGDGFLASFDSPERAIRCALRVLERAHALGLTLRAGVHTGEVEQEDGDVRGIAVHLASRIAARTDSAEILVSGTTRELAAGSGLEFVDRGEQTFRGVSEPRRIYAVVAARSAATEEGAEGGRTAYPAGLTAREVEVLRLIALGLSDSEAARRLFVSVRTVNAHVRSIYRKLGIRSRAAAARFAAENGLL